MFRPQVLRPARLYVQRRNLSIQREPRKRIRLTNDRALSIGDHASLQKAFTSKEVDDFCKMSLDQNSIHSSEEYARSKGFQGRIVPGFLSSSLIAGVIGSKLPGDGTVYTSQFIEYKSPLLIEEPVICRVEVIEIHPRSPLVTFSTKIYTTVDDKEKLIAGGKATVVVPVEKRDKENEPV